MQPLLGPTHYTSKSIFEKEQEIIFSKLWIFAAIKPMLAKHRDYRTLSIAGKSIVLQNHEGIIRAFSNICRHRMARIQNEEFGNRSLVCDYHHWCYGAEGELIHTHSNPSVFGFSKQEISEIKLQQYAVSIIGNLVFINLSEEPPAIEEQFTPEIKELLERYTSKMDDSFIYTRYETNFNWKLGIENIKDPLHVPCLHKSTFPKHFKIELPEHFHLSGAQSVFSSENSSLQDGSVQGGIIMGDTPKLSWDNLVHKLDCSGRYQVFHLFPNVNIMIVDGISFSIQTYNPLSENSTEMQMLVALTKQTDSFSYKPVVLWEHLLSDIKVFQEDIDCLESLQKSLYSSTNDFIHGAYETSILNFQSIYLNTMNISS